MPKFFELSCKLTEPSMLKNIPSCLTSELVCNNIKPATIS